MLNKVGFHGCHTHIFGKLGPQIQQILSCMVWSCMEAQTLHTTAGPELTFDSLHLFFNVFDQLALFLQLLLHYLHYREVAVHLTLSSGAFWTAMWTLPVVKWHASLHFHPTLSTGKRQSCIFVRAQQLWDLDPHLAV